jgi:tellurite resistance protein TerC
VNVPLWAWAAFIVFVLAMLALDLFVLHRGAREVSLREAALWSAMWVVLALGFGGLLFLWQGGGPAEAYLAGYLIEKSLSVDNIFVFALIFSMFGVPLRYQHRVLMCGVIGALVLRAGFIAGGAALLDAFHITIYLFGALLIYTAVRVLRHGGTQIHPDRNPVLRLIRRVIPATDELHGHKFFTRVGGKWLATPLLAVLILIESTDVLFAIDSIPAIFAVTRDTFIVFTSNIFALLGMRALYFLLAGAAQRFVYLQTGLGIILAGVGAKLLLTDVYQIPTWASLVFILLVLAGTFGLSWRATHRRETTAAGLTTARHAREDLHQSRPVTGSRVTGEEPSGSRVLAARSCRSAAGSPPGPCRAGG